MLTLAAVAKLEISLDQVTHGRSGAERVLYS